MLLWEAGWELWGQHRSMRPVFRGKGVSCSPVGAVEAANGLSHFHQVRQPAWAQCGAAQPYSALSGSVFCFCWVLSAVPPKWWRDGTSFPQQIVNHSLLCFLMLLYLLFLSHTIAIQYCASLSTRHEHLKDCVSVFCVCGLRVPRIVSHNNDSGRPPQGWVEQKPVTSGSSAGRLSDLMKSLRLHAGEDWEWEKKLNLNNWILRSRHMLLL